MFDVTHCVKVIDRADELAIKLYEEADGITDRSLRERSREYAVLLEDSANVVRALADALRVVAVLVLPEGPGPAPRAPKHS